MLFDVVFGPPMQFFNAIFRLSAGSARHLRPRLRTSSGIGRARSSALHGLHVARGTTGVAASPPSISAHAICM